MKTVQFNGQQVQPSKIICIGRNYAAHAAELGNEPPDSMVVFIKPNSAISNELQSYHEEQLHYETEITLMVKAGEFHAVAVGLDLTKRALQSQLKAKALPWERAKAFDGAAVFSDFTSLSSVDDLRIELDINGVVTQRGAVSQMLFKPARIMSELKSFITLEDGDLVMTGTPAGVGPVCSGDKFEARTLNSSGLVCAASWLAV